MSIVYTSTRRIEIADHELAIILEVLNQDIWESDGEEKLTVENVVARPKLLDYICKSAIENNGVEDAFDCWNNDGWCDFKKYM